MVIEKHETDRYATNPNVCMQEKLRWTEIEEELVTHQDNLTYPLTYIHIYTYIHMHTILA
jgi:hypothetical protein